MRRSSQGSNRGQRAHGAENSRPGVDGALHTVEQLQSDQKLFMRPPVNATDPQRSLRRQSFEEERAGFHLRCSVMNVCGAMGACPCGHCGSFPYDQQSRANFGNQPYAFCEAFRKPRCAASWRLVVHCISASQQIACQLSCTIPFSMQRSG